MRRHLAAVFVILSTIVLPVARAAAAEPAGKQRTFLFTYAATINGLKPDQVARVWLPLPATSADQKVEVVEQDLPGKAQIGQESKWANHVLYFEAPPRADGTLPLRIVYRVTRREVSEQTPLAGTDAPDAEYLKADALVPLGGKPMSLLANKTLPEDQMQLGRLIYDVVDDHMEYRKDKPGWGRGDAVWACDSGFGNCTDFHSLFISLARTNKMPARFEIGFPIPEKRGEGDVAGYHCWAKFKPTGHGWVPVDISEANKNPAKRDYFFGHLDENRVTFTTGRDLVLVPKQDGPPVNFLIYPYVEVDGKPYAADNVKRQFKYQDVDTAPAAAADHR
jgi:transglutaminase-like putative cysteine protease